MALTPNDLNDAQARHAVQLFFDNLPDSTWEGSKPSIERVNTVVRALQEEATAEDAKLLNSLVDGKNVAAQAGVARLILTRALASPALDTSVQTAIDNASRANMMFDPVTGLLIIGVLLATSKVEKGKDGSFHVDLAGNVAPILSALRVPELLDKLPPVLATLPKELISKII